jgi:hypothetical protein
MKSLRKLVILSHRYLGIVLSLIVMMWSATGITMIFAGGMPRLTPELRLERLPPLDFARVRVTPSEAAGRADVGAPARATLVSVMDRPAYRLSGRETTVVFADTGDVLDRLNVSESRTVASRFINVPPERVQHVRTLRRVDQWTLVQGAQLPLHKFRIDDADETELYVEADTGEVAQLTTRRSRLLAWVSTIPHWLYFTALRTNQPLWARVVVWTSALACVLTVLGLVLAVTQVRRTRSFRPAGAIPYAGWTRWHYLTGALFGVFTLTFAFSGLLSMEPFAWTTATGLQVPRAALTGGPLDLSQFGGIDADAWRRLLAGRAAKEIELIRIQDEPFYVVRHAGNAGDTAGADVRERLHQPYNINGRAEQDRVLVAAANLQVRHAPFSTESLLDRLTAAVPGVPIVESALLTDYDSYYYSRAELRPLPVLRVKFGDPAETWVYVDPAMSQVLAEVHRSSRLERWLYNGLHSMDFASWYRSPAWAAAMVTLCAGGLASSGLGLLLAIRRIARGVTRAVGATSASASAPDRPGAVSGASS